MENEIILNDLVTTLLYFDAFLDEMFYRNAFDTTYRTDRNVQNFVEDMKRKYIPRKSV